VYPSTQLTLRLNAGLPLLFSKRGTKILTIVDSTRTILFSFAAALDALSTSGHAVGRETIAPLGLSRKKLRLAMVSCVPLFAKATYAENVKLGQVTCELIGIAESPEH